MYLVSSSLLRIILNNFFLNYFWLSEFKFLYLGMVKKLFAFEDSFKALAAYESLNFNIQMDDEVNGIYYAEADLTDYDWLAVLTLLEDCHKLHLSPFIMDGQEVISEDTLVYADNKAVEEGITEQAGFKN